MYFSKSRFCHATDQEIRGMQLQRIKIFTTYKKNKMPRKLFRRIKLPMEQPDCCANCPLLGIIPKEERLYGSKETHVCIARQEALSGRGIRVRKSQRDSHHPLKRPCDEYWDVWTQLPGMTYPMKNEFYMRYRLPYEASQQMVIKFHR